MKEGARRQSPSQRATLVDEATRVLQANEAEPLLTELRLDRPLRFIEDHPALDIRALCRTWTAMKGPIRGILLDWSARVAPDLDHVLVAVGVADGETTLKVQIVLGRRDVVQTIRLARSHPNAPPRFFMLCPVTGKRCDLLFLRDGVFASASAQRLVHRSQRAAKAPLQRLF